MSERLTRLSGEAVKKLAGERALFFRDHTKFLRDGASERGAVVRKIATDNQARERLRRQAKKRKLTPEKLAIIGIAIRERRHH